MTVDVPTLADVEAAREVIAGIAVTTAMEESRWLSDLAGGPVLLKCENLQRTGSFKIRGAYLRLSRLTPEERAAGVVAASAGNHAQGVALAARQLGRKRGAVEDRERAIAAMQAADRLRDQVLAGARFTRDQYR